MAEHEYYEVNGRQIRVRPTESGQEIDEYGNFHRQPNHFTKGFGEGENPVEADRYILFWGKGCNWSNRASIARELLGLDKASFCVQPYRYLLKQSNPSEIQRELGTILTYTKEHKGKKYFIVEDDGMYQKIDIDEILYFSIIRRGCEIHILQNGTGKILRTRKRIQEIEEELRREYFCRIHKSFLVNPRYITEVKKSEIKMDNNEILSVSKARRKTFEDMFAEYLSYRK